MTLFHNCIADIYSNTDKPDLRDGPFQVRIDDAELVISYENDDGWVNYRGVNDGSGHFELTAPEVSGRASLHRFPNGKILEGYWAEGDARGMWRITLIE